MSLSTNVINMSQASLSHHVAYRLEVHDGSMRYQLIPVGSRWVQLAMFVLLGLLPVISGCVAAFLFVKSFYAVKFNQFGVKPKSRFVSILNRWSLLSDTSSHGETQADEEGQRRPMISRRASSSPADTPTGANTPVPGSAQAGNGQTLNLSSEARRRVILIATMEYDIEDLAIKVKIGGLGVVSHRTLCLIRAHKQNSFQYFWFQHFWKMSTHGCGSQDSF